MLKRLALYALPLLVALALRVYALDFGMPFALHVDEARFVSAAVNTLQTGDLNPGWFRQPSLYTYLAVLAIGVYTLLAAASGALGGVANLFRPGYYFMGEIPVPGEWLAARALTALLGVATVALVMWCARQWYARDGTGSSHDTALGAPVVAGLLLATSPLHVANSHFITADVLAGLMACAAVAASVAIAERGRARDYALAGLLAGLAASAKYNLGIVALVVPVAHVLRLRGSAWRSGWGLLILAGVAAAAGFLLGTPFALLDHAQFRTDLEYEYEHNVLVGHPGREGASGQFYLELLIGGPDRWLVLAGAVGLVVGLLPGERPERRRVTLLFAAFLVPFALMIASALVHFDRFAVPLLPPLAALGGYAVESVARAAAGRLHARPAWLVVPLALAVLAPPAWAAFAGDRALLERDVMLRARDWLDANVPAGAGVAVETFGALPDPGRYRLLETGRLIDYDAAWYRAQGYAWFVAAAINYQRVFDSAERYPDEAAAYKALFAQWELVATIEGPQVGKTGYTVTVYRAR